MTVGRQKIKQFLIENRHKIDEKKIMTEGSRFGIRIRSISDRIRTLSLLSNYVGIQVKFKQKLLQQFPRKRQKTNNVKDAQLWSLQD